jgi:SAM-dependent methyltransferase
MQMTTTYSSMVSVLKQILPSRVRERRFWRRCLAACPDFKMSDLNRAAAEFLRSQSAEGLRSLTPRPQAAKAVKTIAASKFLDVDHWLRINLVRAAALGLNRKTAKRVLDLGAGPGWFLAVCRFYSHEVQGFDLPYCEICPEDSAVYVELNRALRVAPDIHRGRITAFSPVEIDGEFDVITAFLICFNNLKSKGTWQAAEWRFFLEDIKRHLRPRGILRLQFNPDEQRFPRYLFFDAETRELFRQHGSLSQDTFTLST